MQKLIMQRLKYWVGYGKGGCKRPVNPIFKTVCRREMMFGAPS
jgi:hypothetical protein